MTDAWDAALLEARRRSLQRVHFPMPESIWGRLIKGQAWVEPAWMTDNEPLTKTERERIRAMGEDFTQEEEKELASGWGDASSAVDSMGSGAYVKLDDGQSIMLCVISEPVVTEKLWPGDDRPSVRVKVDVYIPDGGKKTWEMSRTAFKALQRQYKRRGDAFGDSLFELTREGTGMQTRYAIDYVRELTQDEKNARDGVPF